MVIDYKIIGKRIKNARKEINMTQEVLAEKADVSVGYISQIERGICKVNLDTLAIIANILNCDVSFLIDGMKLSIILDTFSSNKFQAAMLRLS